MMKKALFAGIIVLCAYIAYLVISVALLPPVAELKDRKRTMTIQVRDWHGKYHPFQLGPRNRYWTSSENIPAEMKWAVILAEDANFYKHEGVDVKAIKKAIKHDLEKKSLARGASTITQQTAKNIYLSREKTITRKVKELYLALRMEQELTKGRIIELYLNLVELGPMVNGVGHASRYYFGKPASELSSRECAFLAAMLPGPRVAYNPYRNMAKVLRRSDMILKLMKSKGVLSEEEYSTAVATAPNISGLQRKVEESIVREELFANRSAASAVPSSHGSAAEESNGKEPVQESKEPEPVEKKAEESVKP